MNASFQYALPIILILACAVPAGNYLINQKQGLPHSENIRESRKWGIGFIVYALLDYLLLQL